MSEQNKIMEAYKSMVSEMRGATAGRRQSRTFPLSKQSEAEAFAKKHGGKVEKKGATLYVTYDLPEETEIDEATWLNGKKVDTSKGTWKYSNMDYDQAVKQYGKKNVKKGRPSRSGTPGIEIFTKESLDEVRRGKIKSDDQMKKEKDAKAKAWWDAMDKKNTKKEALDPVDDKENDKKFKNRKDKDIDNDGDVDSSDEYLHKRRAATDDAIDAKKDKKKKPAGNSGEKTPEISKIGEKVTTKEDLDALFDALEEAVNQKKGATEPEKIDDKESKSGKDFIAKHAVDKKDHEDMEKIEEPKERKVKKEMTEFEVIRALLSGNPTGE